jgi:5'-deoxynucleotidase YfbR-like HD superfamily hydrolase
MSTNHTKLFRLLEITRAQPQYGYALAEIPKNELSDLAQHHYLVTAIAWQLGRLVQREGGTLDLLRVLEICLMHDLGELFGGDIGMPYAKANPAANKAAKAFEAENLKYFASLFDEDSTHFSELSGDAMQPTSDEALVAKIADYLEVTHYKLYVHRLSKGDISMVGSRIEQMVSTISDAKTQKALQTFIADWKETMSNDSGSELFESSK